MITVVVESVFIIQKIDYAVLWETTTSSNIIKRNLYSSIDKSLHYIGSYWVKMEVLRLRDEITLQE